MDCLTIEKIIMSSIERDATDKKPSRGSLMLKKRQVISCIESVLQSAVEDYSMCHDTATRLFDMGVSGTEDILALCTERDRLIAMGLSSEHISRIADVCNEIIQTETSNHPPRAASVSQESDRFAGNVSYFGGKAKTVAHINSRRSSLDTLKTSSSSLDARNDMNIYVSGYSGSDGCFSHANPLLLSENERLVLGCILTSDQGGPEMDDNSDDNIQSEPSSHRSSRRSTLPRMTCATRNSFAGDVMLTMKLKEIPFSRIHWGRPIRASDPTPTCSDPIYIPPSVSENISDERLRKKLATIPPARIHWGRSLSPAETVPRTNPSALPDDKSSLESSPHTIIKLSQKSVYSRKHRPLPGRIYSTHTDNSAFVFVKPHANVSPACRVLVRYVLASHGVHVIEEGEISAESIDKEKLIDQHYYAIGSKAVMLKPSELDVPADKFESVFGLSWQSVLDQGLAYNAMDACTTLGLNSSELDAAWSKAKDNRKLVKLGGGFYCGLIDTVPGKPAIYVINGFYMSMRSKFVKPGSSIYYFNVEWNSSELSFSDFRNKVLGCTDPTLAPSTSIRGMILSDWRSLGLRSVPNTGDNGVHASASPFEALAERMNWLGISAKDDSFGRKLLDVGIPEGVIQAWSVDPLVKGKSLFDSLEELNSSDCVAKSMVLSNYISLPPTTTSPSSSERAGSFRRSIRQHIPSKDNSAFVFVKPHANVSPACRVLVRYVLASHGVHVIEEGEISAESIDKEKLIDQHYYAIGSKAVMLKPSELDVPADKFESVFGLSWQSVLDQGIAYNAMDACTTLGLNSSELDAAWSKAKDNRKLVKLGGGFYCGLIDTVPGKPAIYVINGFYMSMRSKFVKPGSSIYYFNVEWNSSELSFSDFRNKVLGCTDPTLAPSTSIRGMILSDWRSLGLRSVPNTGDNGVHASASPFEALAERMNWLGISAKDDSFGRKLLDVGIPEGVIQAWSVDPLVKGKSLFDSLEELNSSDCVAKSMVLNN